MCEFLRTRYALWSSHPGVWRSGSYSLSRNYKDYRPSGRVAVGVLILCQGNTRIMGRPGGWRSGSYSLSRNYKDYGPSGRSLASKRLRYLLAPRMAGAFGRRPFVGIWRPPSQSSSLEEALPKQRIVDLAQPLRGCCLAMYHPFTPRMGFASYAHAWG